VAADSVAKIRSEVVDVQGTMNSNLESVIPIQLQSKLDLD